MTHADPEVVRPADIVQQPWANDLGITRVLRNRDEWRLSVAEIIRESEFSSFEGMDRILIPLSPDGVVLEIAGCRREVAQGSSIAFRGEDHVVAHVSGPVEVLNMMVRRSAATMDVRIGGVVTDNDAVVVLSGEVALDGEQLAPGTAVRGPAVTRLIVAADALMASIRLLARRP